MPNKNDYIQLEFSNRENDFTHKPYEDELSFYTKIKNGDLSLLDTYTAPKFKDVGLGTLSKDPIRNIRYHLIITIAMITRICMEGGLTRETAYTLSDYYIQKLDITTSISGLEKLHSEFVHDFTKRMHDIKTGKQVTVSLHVLKTYNYVESHLHHSISTKEIADYLQINESYLCTLFKKETGMTLKYYIEKLKIDAAKNMLTQSEFQANDISNYLCFSNHSHFIKIFKKHTGETPGNYRKKYFLKEFLREK